MQWTNFPSEEYTISIPRNWLRYEYFEAFTILFRFENVLRIFVYTVLKKHKGKDWLLTSVDFEDKTAGTIQSISKKQISLEKNMGYISYPINSPIMQLTAGQLNAIIFSKANWPIFNEYFPGKKDIIENKFHEIIEVRNALAHFRPIKKSDVQIVKQNMDHVLLNVEGYLENMTSITTIVPTNNNQDWYKLLNTLNTRFCSIQSFYSEKEDWTRIAITYDSPIVDMKILPELQIYNVLTLNTSNILNDFDQLCSHCIYVTESVDAKYDPFDSLSAKKSINFIFNSKSLLGNVPFINSMVELFGNIARETESLINEPTAQGKCVKNVICKVKLRDHWWEIESEKLKNQVNIDDVIEYWGDIDFKLNIITDITKYPWMPVSITEDVFF